MDVVVQIVRISMFVVCTDAKNISFFINDNEIVVFVDNGKGSPFFHCLIIDVIKKTRLKSVKKIFIEVYPKNVL